MNNSFTHFRTVWRWRWPIIGLAITAGFFAMILTQRAPKQWQASFVADIVPDRTTSDALRIAEARYTDLAKSTAVVADAIDRARLRRSVPEVTKTISSADSNNVGLLRVSVTASSSADATDLARSLAAASFAASQAQRARELDAAVRPLQDQVVSVQQQLAGTPAGAARDALQARYQTLLTAEQQVVQTQPSDSVTIQYVGTAVRIGSTKALTVGLLAFLVTLVVGGELAALLTALAGRFTPGREREEIARLTQAPVIAEFRSSRGSELEGLWALGSALERLSASGDVRTVAFVSTEAGPASGWLLPDVARTMAARLRVVLVSLPPNDMGDTLPASRPQPDVLSDSAAEVTIPNHWEGVESSFRVLPLFSDLSGSKATVASLARIRPTLDLIDDADLVLLDASAGEPRVPAALLASECDTAVLVVRTRRTRRRLLRDVSDRLDRNGVRVTGIVVDYRKRQARTGATDASETRRHNAASSAVATLPREDVPEAAAADAVSTHWRR
jgi:hypothetical protein